MAEVIHVTAENFDEATSRGVCLLDFWAEWCGPCRMMSEVVDDIAETRSDIKVCKVNVDDERDMAIKFGIDAIPTIILIKNGDTAGEAVGYMQKDELLTKLGL